MYATVPVARMGQVTLREVLLSRAADSDFSAFSLEEVDAAFDHVTPLRWRQTVALTGGTRVQPCTLAQLYTGTAAGLKGVLGTRYPVQQAAMRPGLLRGVDQRQNCRPLAFLQARVQA